ncbi:hypothetical protein [Methylobacter sp.]|nr:hypothetical protein [Methylobacter sp.]
MRTDIASPGSDRNQRRQTRMPACSKLARSKHALTSIKQPPLISFFWKSSAVMDVSCLWETIALERVDYVRHLGVA